MIAYLLAGIGPDYDPFVTSMTSKSEVVTFDDVFAHLKALEARQLQHHAQLQLNPRSLVNYVGRGGQQKNRGCKDRGRGHSQGVCSLVLLVIVMTLLLVLPARSTAKWDILSFAGDIGWMSPIKINFGSYFIYLKKKK